MRGPDPSRAARLRAAEQWRRRTPPFSKLEIVGLIVVAVTSRRCWAP